MNLKLFTNLVLMCFISLTLHVVAQQISKEVSEKLDKMGNEMSQLVISGKYLSLKKYYTEDIIIMPDFNPAIRGKRLLFEQYEKDMNDGIKHHSFTGTVEKRWKHGNEIYERGTFGMAVSSKQSPKPRAYYGSYFQIWRIESDGTYKISFIIWNLDFNPCG